MKPLMLCTLFIFVLIACAPLPQYRTYHPPNAESNMGIEVIQYSEIPIRYELRINDEHVAEMKSMMDYYPSVAAKYKNLHVEMRGEFLPGHGFFVINVYVEGERAANFKF